MDGVVWHRTLRVKQDVWCGVVWCDIGHPGLSKMCGVVWCCVASDTEG